MYKSPSLAAEFNGKIRKQDIIVDQCRTMRNLYKNIFPNTCPVLHRGIVIIRQTVIMKQILGYTGSLSLPVKP